MGERTGIEWTDSTWNPWMGCHKVSPGCKHCYAERETTRWGKDFSQVRRSKTTFDAPLRWKEPRRIFTCSFSDFFIEEADVWRDDAWEVIRQTPQHIYQILTKRPERIAEHLPKTCFFCGMEWGPEHVGKCEDHDWRHPWYGWAIATEDMNTEAEPNTNPWPNVWLGTSVENQKYAEERIPKLVSISAAVHFLSCEPLLGPIDFTHALRYENPEWLKDHGYLRDIEWVIAGGESGPDYRPMDPIWIRDIREQCKSGKVAFFFKQWGGLKPGGPRELDGREWNEFPSEAL